VNIRGINAIKARTQGKARETSRREKKEDGAAGIVEGCYGGCSYLLLSGKQIKGSHWGEKNVKVGGEENKVSI